MEYSRLLWPTPALFAIALLTPLLLFHLRQRKGGSASTLSCLSLTLPLLPAYILLHAQLRSASIRALFSFTLCWVISNRLLLFCFHALQLPAWSFSRPPHFLLSILLPIRIKGPSPPSAHIASYLRPFLFELFASICVGVALFHVPVRARYPLFFLSAYLSIGMPSRAAAVVLHVLYRVEPHPAFNKPWLLPYSLTEFWGRGWNLTANALLRQTVYNPMMGRLLAAARRKPRKGIDNMQVASEGVPELWVRVVCVWATFLYSGLIHEFLWLCILQRSRPASWENLWFFVLHGLGTSAEISCRRLFPWLPAKIPRFFKLAFTLTFVHTTMAWYLFAPQKAMPKEF